MPIDCYNLKVQWNRALPPRDMSWFEHLIVVLIECVANLLIICMYPLATAQLCVDWSLGFVQRYAVGHMTSAMFSLALVVDKSTSKGDLE